MLAALSQRLFPLKRPEESLGFLSQNEVDLRARGILPMRLRPSGVANESYRRAGLAKFHDQFGESTRNLRPFSALARSERLIRRNSAEFAGLDAVRQVPDLPG